MPACLPACPPANAAFAAAPTQMTRTIAKRHLSVSYCCCCHIFYMSPIAIFYNLWGIQMSQTPGVAVDTASVNGTKKRARDTVDEVLMVYN